MRTVLLSTLILLASCKTINKDALAAWVSGDQAMMQDLADYRKITGKGTDDLTAHSKLAIGDIANNDETSLMAELLAYVQADTKKSDQRKASYATRIQAHLNLFHSIKGS